MQGPVVSHRLDLADLTSVDEFASELLKEEQRIDFLILNAGVMACPLAYTKDGFEMQIGTNHFGHWALTEALLPRMTSQVSAGPASPEQP